MSFDNVCKYLAEKYLSNFVKWLLNTEPVSLRILKTELNVDPIRADSVLFLKMGQQILHLEFQTEPQSKPPLPCQVLGSCTSILAGLRFDKTLVNSLFQEEIMKDSVIYQDILEKGEKKGSLKLVMMQLNLKFPQLEERLINRIKTLSLSDLEELAISLLEFKDVNDLEAWLGYPEL